MNRNLKTSILLLGLVLFAACSNDDDGQVAQEPSQEQKQTTPKSYPLSIEVAENPMIQEGESESRTTRAAITTGSTLSTFYMNYVYNTTENNGADPETASKDGEGKWTTTGSWPDTDNDNVVSWYAYSKHEDKVQNFFLDVSNNPYINFTVEEAAASQHDLLVATTSGTWNNTKGNLSFTFDHACSALLFKVKKSTNLNDYTLNVTSIVLKNVYKHGKYYYGTSTWNDIDTYTDYTLYSGSAMTLGSTSSDYVALNGTFGTAENPYLFVIPQTLTAWNPSGDLGNSYLEVVCNITKISDSSNVFSGTAYIPFGATFVAGTKYNVNINIGMNSLYSGPNTKIIN